MYGSEVDQDINCRTVGRCGYGDVIDRELLDMVPREGEEWSARGSVAQRRARRLLPLSEDCGRQFLYARYNADLTVSGMRELGFENADVTSLLRMDLATPENITTLYAVGQKVGNAVRREHFGNFI